MDKAKILIVEDESIVAMEIQSTLEKQGYSVCAIVDTGEKAIKKAMEEDPSLILMDITLKGNMDGIEAASQIQSKKDTPIIFVTAYAEEEKLGRARPILPYGYLLKPVQERDLKVSIDMALYASKINLERLVALATVKKMNEELEIKVQERTNDFKKAKEAAETANQIKSDFLANITHELRNPLHHILSFSNFGVKKTGTVSNTKIVDYFKTIRKSGNGLLNLVNDLLDLSKLESGKTDYEMSRINLKDMINEIIFECISTSAEKNITISVLETQENTNLNGDQNKISQVIRNLISNAIKFTPPEGNITVFLDMSESSYQEINHGKKTSVLLTSIKDEGIGIPEDELDSVFDKFVQSSLTEKKSGGTGLGLAICKEIINAHNGKIWAESNPKCGSTFRFCLPIDSQAILKE